jgi:hypothetical protein
VQRSIAAGVARDQSGQDRAFVVQEWVEGTTLEGLRETSLDLGSVQTIIMHLVGHIVIPLWSVGTVWWDLRDANLCWNRDSSTLSLIDTESLGAYSQEILARADRWTQREKGRVAALRRCRQMVARVVAAGSVRARPKLERAVARAFTRYLEHPLAALGRDPDAPGLARHALDQLLYDIAVLPRPAVSARW